MNAAALSPIIIAGAAVLPEVTFGQNNCVIKYDNIRIALSSDK